MERLITIQDTHIIIEVGIPTFTPWRLRGLCLIYTRCYDTKFYICSQWGNLTQTSGIFGIAHVIQQTNYIGTCFVKGDR